MDEDISWGNESFEEWAKNDKDSKEIVKIMQAIHILMDGCTHNLTTSQLETIQKEMKLSIKQCIFWQKENNRQRFIYDLREFATWLADFISDAEEKFWGYQDNS